MATPPPSLLHRAAAWAGWEVDDAQVEAFTRFTRWLQEEAHPAGGVGPSERGRLERRHVADSVLFAGGWPGDEPPEAVLDLGSGVGLPGIPLAILWRDAHVICLDRSGSRARLVRRVVRILRLPNVEVVEGDAARTAPLERRIPMAVARAAAAPAVVRTWTRHLAPSAQVLVLGGSHQQAPVELEPGESVREVPAGVLDRTVWLRIMAPP